MIFLLDLNYTLVDQKWPRPREVSRKPFAQQIEEEEYRLWLIALLGPAAVILVTARPQLHRERTLWSLWRKTRWAPMEAHFNDLRQRPPLFKQTVLCERIMRRYGDDPAAFFAIESNPRTRAMYRRHGVQSTSVREEPWTSLDEMIHSAV